MELLQTQKEQLFKAQSNEVYWKRSFPNEENLDWLLLTSQFFKQLGEETILKFCEVTECYGICQGD